MVTQQLDQISVIGRCEYGKTCNLLVQLFDQAAQSYQEMISNMNASKIEATIQEGRLTWLVYIIGAAVGGRVSFNSNDEHDAMDGELVCRVLQLMDLTDRRLSQVRFIAVVVSAFLSKNLSKSELRLIIYSGT